MSDNQTIMPFPPGTLVWIKVYNRIWWPGKVVDPTTAPEEMQVFMNRKKNPIAMVFFERDNKFDIVINMDKISLYSCPNKMEYIKKGYFLSLKEKKEKKIQNIEMENFKKDVIKFEEETNGNLNIFLEFEKKHIPQTKELIKELFVNSKVLEKKEMIEKPITNFKTPSKMRRNVRSPSPKKIQKSPVCISCESPSGSGAQIFVCHLKLGCNFTTKRYENLKWHMAFCKNIVEDGTRLELKSESQNKQRTTTILDSPKITKINDEIREVFVRENRYDNNYQNNNAKPGCSTMFNEYNKETVLNKNNDKITNIATNTTENIENLEDSRTIQKNHGNSYVDSNEINDLMLIENSFQGSTDSETNDTLNLNMIANKINDIISYEENNKPQENLNNSADHKNRHSFYLNSREMENFKKDIIKFEEETNGNVNNFLEFEKKDEEHIAPPKQLIKEHFVPSKVLEKEKSTKKPVNNFKTPSKVRRNLHSLSPKKIQKSPVRKSPESPSRAQIFVCHLKLGCNFTTKRYEILKRHMAFCKNIVEDGTRLELKSETQSESQNKPRTTTTILRVKKTKIIEEISTVLARGNLYYDNYLNNNANPGCSTIFNEYNKETVLNKNNNEITNIATNTTESIENLEDSRTIQKNHGNSYVDSNEINDLLPCIIGTNMLIENSYQGSTDSETNETLNLNMIENKINDIIIGYEENNKPQENLNNSTDRINHHSFDLDSRENMQSTSSQQFNDPLIEGPSIHDQEQNQSCSSDVILVSEIEKLDDPIQTEMNFDENYPFKMFNEEEEKAKKAFLKDILNGNEVTHINLDNVNIASTKDETTKDQGDCCVDDFELNAQWLRETSHVINEGIICKEVNKHDSPPQSQKTIRVRRILKTHKPIGAKTYFAEPYRSLLHIKGSIHPKENHKPQENLNNSADHKNPHSSDLDSRENMQSTSSQQFIDPLMEGFSIHDQEQNLSCSSDVINEGIICKEVDKHDSPPQSQKIIRVRRILKTHKQIGAKTYFAEPDRPLFHIKGCIHPKENNKPQENLNNSTDLKNPHSSDLDSRENMQSTSSQQFIDPLMEGFSIHDQEQNLSCSSDVINEVGNRNLLSEIDEPLCCDIDHGPSEHICKKVYKHDNPTNIRVGRILYSLKQIGAKTYFAKLDRPQVFETEPNNDENVQQMESNTDENAATD